MTIKTLKAVVAVVAGVGVSLFALAARAETPQDFLKQYETAARQPGSAQRGQAFFTQKHGGEWSCSSCHTPQLTDAGKHASTGKAIKPLAPSANPDRFTRADKVDKWFGRNCNDVLKRECTPAEKADVMAYVLSFK